MKLYNILFIVFSIYLVSCAPQQRTDAEKMGLYGKVKSVEERYYTIKGDTIQEDWECDSRSISTHYFDELGMLLKYIYDGCPYEEMHYVYSNNQLQSTVFYLGGFIDTQYQYEYEDGHLYAIISKDSEGNIFEKEIFTYDRKDRLQQSVTYRVDGEVLSSKEYDTKGNIIKLIFDTGATEEYEYNDNNLVSKINQIALQSINTLEYEFDACGSWVKCIYFNEPSHEAYYMKQRTIEYYN